MIKRIISCIIIFTMTLMVASTAFAEVGIVDTYTYVDYDDSPTHRSNNGRVGVSYSAYAIPSTHVCQLIIKIIENKAFGPAAYDVFETSSGNRFSDYHLFTGLPIATNMKTRFTKSPVVHPNQMRVAFEINTETA